MNSESGTSKKAPQGKRVVDDGGESAPAKKAQAQKSKPLNAMFGFSSSGDGGESVPAKKVQAKKSDATETELKEKMDLAMKTFFGKPAVLAEAPFKLGPRPTREPLSAEQKAMFKVLTLQPVTSAELHTVFAKDSEPASKNKAQSKTNESAEDSESAAKKKAHPLKCRLSSITDGLRGIDTRALCQALRVPGAAENSVAAFVDTSGKRFMAMCANFSHYCVIPEGKPFDTPDVVCFRTKTSVEVEAFTP